MCAEFMHKNTADHSLSHLIAARVNVLLLGAEGCFQLRSFLLQFSHDALAISFRTSSRAKKRFKLEVESRHVLQISRKPSPLSACHLGKNHARASRAVGVGLGRRPP